MSGDMSFSPLQVSMKFTGTLPLPYMFGLFRSNRGSESLVITNNALT